MGSHRVRQNLATARQLWFWRSSLILIHGYFPFFFLQSICVLHFLVTFYVHISIYNEGREFFRILGLHVAGGNSIQIFIKVIPKQGGKMEFGSEVIICCVEVSFMSRLLLVCWNWTFICKQIEFVNITPNGVYVLYKVVVSVSDVRILGHGLYVFAV